MENLEMVERLVNKTGVAYSEARDALLNKKGLLSGNKDVQL